MTAPLHPRYPADELADLEDRVLALIAAHGGQTPPMVWPDLVAALAYTSPLRPDSSQTRSLGRVFTTHLPWLVVQRGWLGGKRTASLSVAGDKTNRSRP